MKGISISLVVIISIISSCHKGNQNTNPQLQFLDPSFRLGKWYSITDTAGDSRLETNTLLDTIWFINDTLAGWTGFVPYQPSKYVFWKTYLDPTSIYKIIYLAPDVQNPNLTDTFSHQFAINGDTLTILWDFGPPIQIEQYLKKK